MKGKNGAMVIAAALEDGRLHLRPKRDRKVTPVDDLDLLEVEPQSHRVEFGRKRWSDL